jgi:hypothetical protein
MVTRLFPNGWTVKDSPYVMFASALRRARQVRSDAAGVHERDLGAALVGRRRGGQLGVGDDVAERRLTRGVRGAGDRGGDLADDAVQRAARPA